MGFELSVFASLKNEKKKTYYCLLDVELNIIYMYIHITFVTLDTDYRNNKEVFYLNRKSSILLKKVEAYVMAH